MEIKALKEEIALINELRAEEMDAARRTQDDLNEVLGQFRRAYADGMAVATGIMVRDL